VEVLAGGEGGAPLPVAGVDLIFVANAYHEFSKPRSMLDSFRRALAPGGRLIVIEYAEERDEDPTVGVEGMMLEQLRSEIESAGFQLERTLDFLPLQHGLIFIASR
jgi:ubiquinone/menaquinone biosynthesis C-methylase UbiE